MIIVRFDAAELLRINGNMVFYSVLNDRIGRYDETTWLIDSLHTLTNRSLYGDLSEYSVTLETTESKNIRYSVEVNWFQKVWEESAKHSVTSFEEYVLNRLSYKIP